MQLIIPMAGMGKRMRPHTITLPKPLFPIAGKPIVERLIEDISKVVESTIDEIAFIIGDFGKEVEAILLNIAEKYNAKGTIYYQTEALGTAHAILCAAPSLKGETMVAFADTLFKAEFVLNNKQDGIIWTKKVENPESFGVVKLNEQDVITNFYEKPTDFVSDLAIIGIYYFKDGAFLKDELQYLIDNSIIVKGEYQLTDALANMKNKGLQFKTDTVEEWLDCGNKNATVNTNQRILEIKSQEFSIPENAKIVNSIINQPCFIDENTRITNAVIGPHVSVGKNTVIENCVIKNAVIQENALISEMLIENSIIGNQSILKGELKSYSIGDYSKFE